MTPGPCRLNSNREKGVENVDYFAAKVETVDECKSLCDDTSACVAIEVNNGQQCNLWVSLPKFTSGAKKTSLSCYLKTTPTIGEDETGEEEEERERGRRREDMGVKFRDMGV